MAKKQQPGRPPAASATGTQRGRQGYTVGTSKRGIGTGSRTPAGGSGAGNGRLIAVIAGVVVVVAVAVVAYFVLAGEDENAYAEGLTAAGCTDQTLPDLGTEHIADDAPEPETYNSTPPTSGPHRAAPALWGVYDSPIEPSILLHNLEHGGLVVQYGDGVPPQTRVALQESVLSDRDFMVIAPRPELGDKIAYTTWTRLVTCTGFDERVIEGVRERRNRPPAPEPPHDPSEGRQPNF